MFICYRYHRVYHSSQKSPFFSPPDKRDEAAKARQSFSNGSGDLLTDAKAYEVWSAKRKEKGMAATRRWCDEGMQSTFDTRSNHSELPRILNLVGHSIHASISTSFCYAGSRTYPLSTTSTDVMKLSKSSASDSLVRALVASAPYRNVARIVMPTTKYEKLSSGSLALDPEARAIKLFTSSETPDDRDERVFIHPGSTLFSQRRSLTIVCSQPFSLVSRRQRCFCGTSLPSVLWLFFCCAEMRLKLIISEGVFKCGNCV